MSEPCTQSHGSAQSDVCGLWTHGRTNVDLAPLMVRLTVCGTDLDVELDTGAVVSLSTERTYEQKFSHIPMRAFSQKASHGFE